MANNYEETDKSLLFLDQELISGYTKLCNLKDERPPKTVFATLNIDHEGWEDWQKSHCKKIRTEFDKWVDSIKKHLDKNSDKGQIQYHFLIGTDKDKLRKIIESRRQTDRSSNMGLSNLVSAFLLWTETDEIELLITQWEKYLQNLEEIILRLEDSRNIQIKKEIAEIQNKSDILYEIKYSDHTREIKLNNIIITKPDFESENEKFFTFVYSRPNTPIAIEDIEEYYKGGKLKKRVTDIVRDLGFNGKIRQIFFPVVQQDKVMFCNPITKKQAAENDLPAVNISNLGDSGRDRELKRGKTTTK